VETIGRNAQFALAFYPREQSKTHIQVGAGLGQSHVMFSSRQAEADGEGTGPILSALFGTEWKMFYLTAGARFHRMPINYTRLDDLGIRSDREFRTTLTLISVGSSYASASPSTGFVIDMSPRGSPPGRRWMENHCGVTRE
jgi:hypothetical protein